MTDHNLYRDIEKKLDSLRQLLLLYGSQDNTSILLQQYVTILCSSIDSLYELLEDFREVYELCSGRAGLHYTSFDLMELLDAIAERLRSDAHPHRIDLTLPVISAELRVTADRNRFRKALYYFLSGILVPAGDGGLARIDVESGNRLLQVLVVTPLQPGDVPVRENQSGIRPDKLLRFHTARELVRHQGGSLLYPTVPTRYSQYVVSLPLLPQ